MHGGFGRDSTFNNMAAMGPDFKTRYADPLPAGNADIAPTLAQILGLTMKPNGKLTGRVLAEALTGAPATANAPVQYLRSATANGKQTLLIYQEHAGTRYLTAACFVDASATNSPTACR